MNLSRFGRWALGLYPPSIPTDLRLTDIRPVDSEHSEIVARADIPDADRKRFTEYQQSHHAMRNTLAELAGEREILEEEQRRAP